MVHRINLRLQAHQAALVQAQLETHNMFQNVRWLRLWWIRIHRRMQVSRMSIPFKAHPGDINIASYYPIADEAWAYADMHGTCTSPLLINNGIPSVLPLTGSYAMYSNIMANGSYPAGNTDVGVTSCTNGTSSNYVNVEEEGMLIAYSATPPNSLSNFPVLVDIPNDPHLKAHAQASGTDILFTDSTGENLLNYQIASYSAAQGLQAYVNVATLSATTDTIIYMYYGNPSAASQANAPNTWNSNYKRVYHLSEVGGASPIDSTSNNKTGTLHGGVTESIAGALGYGMAFNGTTGYITAADTGMPTGTQPWSIEAWTSTTSLSQTGAPPEFAMYGTGSNGKAAIIYDDNASTNIISVDTWNSNIIDSGVNMTSGTPYFVVGTYDGTNLRIYVNGVLDGTLAASPNITLSSIYIGADSGGDEYNGIIDEVRYSKAALSSAWLPTEYTNDSSPSTFLRKGILKQILMRQRLISCYVTGSFSGALGLKAV